MGGQVISRWWSGRQWCHPLAGEGFGEADRVAVGDDDVGVVQEPVDGGGGEALGHDRVEAGGVEVGGDGDGAAFVGGVDEAVEGFGGVLAGGELADVVNDDEVAIGRCGRSPCVIEASILARPTVMVSDSRLNQATRMPASMTAWPRASTKWLLPVPDGPAMARFSARPTHSRVRNADWVGAGMEESSGRHDSKVLPAGNPAALAALAAGGVVTTGGFFFEQDTEHFGGVPALRAGGGEHVGGGGAHVGQPHAAQHGGELVGDRWWCRRLHHSLSSSSR